jgi:hypothetical protein
MTSRKVSVAAYNARARAIATIIAYPHVHVCNAFIEHASNREKFDGHIYLKIESHARFLCIVQSHICMHAHRNKLGRTPLMIAAMSGDIESMKGLLAKGARALARYAHTVRLYTCIILHKPPYLYTYTYTCIIYMHTYIHSCFCFWSSCAAWFALPCFYRILARNHILNVCTLNHLHILACAQKYVFTCTCASSAFVSAVPSVQHVLRVRICDAICRVCIPSVIPMYCMYQQAHICVKRIQYLHLAKQSTQQALQFPHRYAYIHTYIHT